MNRLTYLSQKILDAIPLSPEVSEFMERQETLSPREISEFWMKNPDVVISAAFHSQGDMKAFALDPEVAANITQLWEMPGELIYIAQIMGNRIRQALSNTLIPDDDLKIERFKRLLDERLFKDMPAKLTGAEVLSISMTSFQTICFLMAIETVKAGKAPECIENTFGSAPALDGLLEELVSLAENSPVAKEIAMWMLENRATTYVGIHVPASVNFLQNAKRDLLIARYIDKDDLVIKGKVPTHKIYNSIVMGSIISEDLEFKELCINEARNLLEPARKSMDEITKGYSSRMPPESINRILAKMIDGIYDEALKHGARVSDLLPGIQMVLHLFPSEPNAHDPSGLLTSVEFDSGKAAELLAHYSKIHPRSLNLQGLRSHGLNDWQAEVVKKAFPGPRRVQSQDLEP